MSAGDKVQVRRDFLQSMVQEHVYMRFCITIYLLLQPVFIQGLKIDNFKSQDCGLINY